MRFPFFAAASGFVFAAVTSYAPHAWADVAPEPIRPGVVDRCVIETVSRTHAHCEEGYGRDGALSARGLVMVCRAEEANHSVEVWCAPGGPAVSVARPPGVVASSSRGLLAGLALGPLGLLLALWLVARQRASAAQPESARSEPPPD